MFKAFFNRFIRYSNYKTSIRGYCNSLKYITLSFFLFLKSALVYETSSPLNIDLITYLLGVR